MPNRSAISGLLSRPGNLVFPPNLPYMHDLEAAHGRIVHQASGHVVVYNRRGLRILATDPDGHPLHECEWVFNAGGMPILGRARLCLDWGQWVGIKPGGLINETKLNLSTRPGWQRLQSDDLRLMAAEAMHVPIDEVRFFYGDADLAIDSNGIATIRHCKDALFVLPDGTFTGARFMACMGAMHWHRIDFLPVVELFQSLLPGTGSAAFEFIRGLYDDQNERSVEPLPLRYRGIPTYPSHAAFQLFSSFFTPVGPSGTAPLPVFMDQSRSHEVEWLPASDPPRRYFGDNRRLCVTVKGCVVTKVTRSDDPTGLPYIAQGPGRMGPCERTAHVEEHELILCDRGRETIMPANPQWGALDDTPGPRPSACVISWDSVFSPSPPEVKPGEAFAAAVLYPDDAVPIGELPTQPFVADYLRDLVEEDRDLAQAVRRAYRILIRRFDAAIMNLLMDDRVRNYTVLFEHDAFAQRQAQMLWNQYAAAQRLEWIRAIRMVRADGESVLAATGRYDVIYDWIPFSWYDRRDLLQGVLEECHACAGVAAHVFVVGPSDLSTEFGRAGLEVEWMLAVETLPTFRMHQSILPRATVKPGVTVYRARKGRRLTT